MLRDHHVLVEQLLAHHDGQVVKFERDGFLASFNSAHGGLHAAVELQRTFGGGGLGGRIATISLSASACTPGFVIASPDQLLGRNVVLAARIAALAGPGEILVSSTLKEYTESDPSFDFDSGTASIASRGSSASTRSTRSSGGLDTHVGPVKLRRGAGNGVLAGSTPLTPEAQPLMRGPHEWQ